jgi:hypothetical protein
LSVEPLHPDPLTEDQRTALSNLARKLAGHEVGFISIADARALTDLGLAERNRSGWRITAAGEAALAGAEPATPPTAEITSPDAFKPKG